MHPMRVPHIRVLQALADAGQPLTLIQLTTAAGYNEGSGTASRALYGVPEGSSSGPEQTGLLALGYVHDEQIQGAGGGRAVNHFSITPSGTKVLEEELAATGGNLPPPGGFADLDARERFDKAKKDQRDSTDMADANNTNIVDDPHDLNRFVQAQKGDYKQGHAKYEQALAEIRSGQKSSCWMWYIFPQHVGLAKSPKAKFYGIKTIEEAKAYLAHPVLGPRLVECAEAALGVERRTALEIFGPLDEPKLKSCATLFACVSPAGSVFHRLLDKYFQGKRSRTTLRLLGIAPEPK
jgi:uncharacterized protein (DUF1810 family)